MKGRTHAVSGLAVWLSGCAALSAAGSVPGRRAVIAGALACAGAALLNDLDHPDSTVAYTFGSLSRAVARLVSRGCRRVYAATSRAGDVPARDGHRTLTHTVLFALAAGLGTVLLCWVGGTTIAAPVLFALVGLGLRGTVGRALRRMVLGTSIVAALITAAVVLGTPAGSSWWWLGVAVGAGVLAHTLGDALTRSGCPLLWPVPVGGQRWRRIGVPQRWRLHTGGLAERWIVTPVLLTVLLLDVALLT